MGGNLIMPDPGRLEAKSGLLGAPTFVAVKADGGRAACWNLRLDVLNCRIGDSAVRRLDVSAMFACLWLLASMMIDAVTPKELTFYMIAAVTAPAVAVLAVLYWRGIPKQDFAIVFATLWLVAAIILEFISPRPLHPLAAVIAGAPLVIVGCAIYYLRWRRSRQRPNSANLDV
jgi:hypothetical protein